MTESHLTSNQPESDTVWSVPPNGTRVPEAIPVISTVRVNLYPLVQEKIEDAVLAGINRAFKHTDAPSKGMLADRVSEYVMNTLSELFDFGDKQ